MTTSELHPAVRCEHWQEVWSRTNLTRGFDPNLTPTGARFSARWCVSVRVIRIQNRVSEYGLSGFNSRRLHHPAYRFVRLS
jgi:hypothetical protein